MSLKEMQSKPPEHFFGAVLMGIAPFFDSAESEADFSNSSHLCKFNRFLPIGVSVNQRMRLFLCHFLTVSAPRPRCRSPPSDLFWILPQKQIGEKKMDKQFIYYSGGQPEEVPSEVFEALVESDNKIRYFEHDLKVELTVRRKGQTVTLPSREDSLERLMELHTQFSDESVNVADEVEHAMMLDKLRKCLALLDTAELELIQALYFEGYTERSWSEVTGVLQKTINNRKHRILDKLHKLLESQK